MLPAWLMGKSKALVDQEAPETDASALSHALMTGEFALACPLPVGFPASPLEEHRPLALAQGPRLPANIKPIPQRHRPADSAPARLCGLDTDLRDLSE